MQTLLLDIITPEKIAYSEEINFVSVPASDGEMTILPNHMPLFASLSEGVVRIRKENEDFYLSIGGGFVEVKKDKVVLLVSRAFKETELNESMILKAKQQAEKALKEGVTDKERQAAQALLRSVLVDLQTIKRLKRKRKEQAIL